MIKVYAALVAVSAILGALWYVDHLQSENEILTLNARASKEAELQWAAYARDKAKDVATKSRQARVRMEQIAALSANKEALARKLKEVTTHDPVVVECLAVQPGADYINQLREYTRGKVRSEGGEAVSGELSLRPGNS